MMDDERPLEPGEIGIVLKSQFENILEAGDEALVIKGLTVREAQNYKTGEIKALECYIVECKPYKTIDGFVWKSCCIRRHHIRRKKPDEREDCRIVKWSDCIWKPAHLIKQKASIE